MPIVHRFRLQALTVFSFAFLVSGCAIFSPHPDVPRTTEQYKAGPLSLPYAPPGDAGVSGAGFRVAETDTASALQAAKTKLMAAGLTDVRVNAQSNTITGRSSDPALLDCGTLVVSSDDGPRAVPANSALAVLPADRDGPVDFVRRSFAGKTDFEVRVGSSSSGASVNAQVSERHQVQASVVSADRTKVLNREKASIGNGEKVRFQSNMSCMSAGVVRQILD